MHWELWDIESKNLVEDFDTEDEALQAVREILAVNRPDYIDALALGAMYDEGEPRDEELPPVLRGVKLRVRVAAAAQESRAVATRAVHELIRRWMADEGWDAREAPDPQASLKLVVTLREGQTINILQDDDHRDHVTIAQHWTFPDAFRSDFSQLPANAQKIIILDAYRSVQMTGIDMDLLGVPPTDMRFLAYVYFDGLTKDVLIQRILSVLRAYPISMRTIARGFEAAGRSSETASVPSRLVS